MASIIVLNVKVPFTRGGQDALVSTLMAELRARGHDVDSIDLPFHPAPKEKLLTQAAMWRALDVSEFSGRKIDLVIATKFPSYFVRHPKKSVWLVHQHREMYDLYGTRFSDFSDDPRSEDLRRLLWEGDDIALGECAFRAGISKNVVQRLKSFNKLDAEPLYPPLPLVGRYRSDESQDYILSVGRICSIKRVDLMLKALPIVHREVRLKIVGTADEPGIMDYLKNEIDKHHLWDRVEFVGRASDDALISLYANALGVYYAPHNEDYGYVTLEAFASERPVITAHDSGGVLEFVRHEENGLVVEPTTDAIGHAVNRLFEDKTKARAMGRAAKESLRNVEVGASAWDHITSRLLSPLAEARG